MKRRKTTRNSELSLNKLKKAALNNKFKNTYNLFRQISSFLFEPNLIWCLTWYFFSLSLYRIWRNLRSIRLSFIRQNRNKSLRYIITTKLEIDYLSFWFKKRKKKQQNEQIAAENVERSSKRQWRKQRLKTGVRETSRVMHWKIGFGDEKWQSMHSVYSTRQKEEKTTTTDNRKKLHLGQTIAASNPNASQSNEISHHENVKQENLVLKLVFFFEFVFSLCLLLSSIIWWIRRFHFDLTKPVQNEEQFGYKWICPTEKHK